MRFVKLLIIKRAFDYFSKDMVLVDQIRGLIRWKFDSLQNYNYVLAIIKETKDISTLDIHELMGSLEMYEQRLGRHSDQPIENASQSKVDVNEPSK